MATSERRAWARYEFGVEQEVAFCVDGKPPSSDAFESALILDISRTGFSFHRFLPPEHEYVVAAIGDPCIYLEAKIVYCVRRERWGRQFYRIGCQFTRRMHLCGDSLSAAEDAENGCAVFVSGKYLWIETPLQGVRRPWQAALADRPAVVRPQYCAKSAANALSTLDLGVVDRARDPRIKGSLARSTTANPDS